MGKRESCQSVDQVAPGLASQQEVVLGARSQACCHAEAFTGTQRKIEGCWQQVAALIHPGTVSAQPPSFSVSLGAASIGAAEFRTRARGLSVRLGNTDHFLEEKNPALLFFPPFCDKL